MSDRDVFPGGDTYWQGRIVGALEGMEKDIDSLWADKASVEGLSYLDRQISELDKSVSEMSHLISELSAEVRKMRSKISVSIAKYGVVFGIVVAIIIEVLKYMIGEMLTK